MLQRKISRRGFLKKAVAGLVAATVVPTELTPKKYFQLDQTMISDSYKTITNLKPSIYDADTLIVPTEWKHTAPYPLRSAHAEEWTNIPGIRSVELNVEPEYLYGDDVVISVDALNARSDEGLTLEQWLDFKNSALIENARIAYINVSYDTGSGTFPLNRIHPP